MTASQDDPALLAGRSAIVTGSTRGLGLAFAHELGRRGAAVVINGRDEAAGRRACAALAAEGTTARFVVGSVTDVPTAEALVAAAVDHHGGVDIVVNNAGHLRDATARRMTTTAFDDVVATHLGGTWNVTRAALEHLVTSPAASLVNVVSGSALYGLVGQANYAAAKGGVLALTRALSVELARHDIRVNALYPVALTDMTETVVRAAAAAGVPASDLPRFGPADAVAPVVAYLASDLAREVTGQLLSFDGRELRVWTHPAPASTAVRDRTWTVADVGRAFTDGTLRPEPLHPDPLGVLVRRLLAPPSPTTTAPATTAPATTAPTTTPQESS